VTRRRAAVVVLDACGVGELPDAAAYGDAGASTLPHLARAAGGLDLPVLERLGLGSIVPIEGVAPAEQPAVHGRLAPLGPGKDSTTGHWELMGVVAPAPLPTYPDGFPAEVVAALERATGLRFCCNRPANGVAVVRDFGAHHLRTGEVILYTSADSVLQLAAHVDLLPEPELHAACATARQVMTGEHAVGRVIARPFRGAPGAFERTLGRRDFSVRPPSRSYLEELQDDGIAVHAVGKVRDLFAGVGVDEAHAGATNERALAETTALLERLDAGFVFTNLVETDQVYGHRKDVPGFHAALRRIDDEVGRWLGLLGDGDLLVLTADHGCDPAAPHSDHTREHAPLLACFPGHDGRRHDGALADVGASALRWLRGRDAPALPGEPFL
jgi:phosphopentomutase